jgi:serine/threonine protein kinase
MGVVYLGAAADGQPVAVKVLRPQLAEDRDFRKRFGREVAALTRVQGVCTVKVIEADTTSTLPFLVTEYAEGPSLAEYIEARGPLSARMLFGLATGLAEALVAIHEAGIVHRDLKPSNVLLTGTGPKVIDFGIAQTADATSLTRPGMTVGSTGFVAPEQISDGRSGPASDVFAWGVTIAYAASGQPPFGTGTPEIIMYRVLRSVPDLITVPAELRPLVASSLAKEPGRRPGARDLLNTLTSTAAQPDNATQTVLKQPDNATQTILAQTWRAPEPGPAAKAPAAPRPAAPAATAQAPQPAGTGPVAQAFGPTEETPIPDAFRQTEPPRPSRAQPAQAWPPPTWPQQPGSGARAPKRAGRRRAVLWVVAIILALAVAAVVAIVLAGHHHNASAGATGTPTVTRSAPAPAALPALVAGSYHGIKPTNIAFSADAGNIVTGLTWSSWTATRAIGSGTSDIDSCIPDCASAPTDLVTTTLVLSQPVNGHFTVISEMRNNTAEAFVYPNTWAINAS